MYSKASMLTALGIDLQIDLNPKRLLEGQAIIAYMPVDERTISPYNMLSGGASLALAESLAGYGSTLICEEHSFPSGIQVSANHIASAKNGETLTATAEIVHKGRSTHVWNIDIRDSNNRLISSIRVTNMIIKKG